MFALAPIPPTVFLIGGIALLCVLGAGVLGVGTFAVARFVKARKAAKAGNAPVATATAGVPMPIPTATPVLGGILNNLGSLNLANLPPEVKQIVSVLLPAAHQAQQAAVNALVVKMFPWAAPFIPGIDKALLGLDTIIDNKLGIGQSSASDAASAPSVPATPVFVPPGHEVLDLLRDALKARKAQEAARKAA